MSVSFYPSLYNICNCNLRVLGTVTKYLSSREKYIGSFFLYISTHYMLTSQEPSSDKLNGPPAGYTIAYREVGASVNQTVSASVSATAHTIQNLKKWTRYKVNMRVRNRDHPGPWSPEKETRTQQDGQLLVCSLIYLSPNKTPVGVNVVCTI